MKNYTDFKDKVVSENINEKVRVLFDIYEEIRYGYIKNSINTIKHLFDTTYNIPTDYVDELLTLFGVDISDLSLFTDQQKEDIKNNFLNNIFNFYRIKLKDTIYYQIMYIYGLQGAVYPLETYDWISYYRTNCYSYTDIELSTDCGLYTDMDLTTDQGYRTPFVEIEFLLYKKFDNNKLWYIDIDSIIKNEMELIRHVLTKLFYSLRCDIECEEGEIITNDNGITSDTEVVGDIHNVRRYKIIYTDLTYNWFNVNEFSEDENNYYIYTKNRFISDKLISKIEFYDYAETNKYIDITFPEIYLKTGDDLICNLTILKV